MTDAKVAAGALRHRLTIQAVNPQDDGGGGQGADPWAAPVTVAVVWGSVEPLAGGERLRAMRLEGHVTHRIAIRHRTGIDPTMRVVLGGRVFNIRAVFDPDERKRRLELLCEEGVAT